MSQKKILRPALFVTAFVACISAYGNARADDSRPTRSVQETDFYHPPPVYTPPAKAKPAKARPASPVPASKKAPAPHPAPDPKIPNTDSIAKGTGQMHGSSSAPYTYNRNGMKPVESYLPRGGTSQAEQKQKTQHCNTYCKPYARWQGTKCLDEVTECHTY